MKRAPKTMTAIITQTIFNNHIKKSFKWVEFYGQDPRRPAICKLVWEPEHESQSPRIANDRNIMFCGKN